MLPDLFHIGPFPIGTHDFFVLLGVIAAALLYLYEARRRAMLNDQLLWVAIGSLFCGALAARLSTAWQYLVLAPEPSLLGMLEQGGKSILGSASSASRSSRLWTSTSCSRNGCCNAACT